MGKLRSFTRLIIGGLAVGYDSLSGRVVTWEKEIEDTDARPSAAQTGPAPLQQAHPEEPGDSHNRIVLEPIQEETDADRARYALVGMAFSLQEGVERSLVLANRVTRVVGNFAEPFVQPLASSRLVAPVRNRFDRLVERGESTVDRWIEVGRVEEAHSRALMKTGWYERVDSSIEYLAKNTEVQELVQSQSVGLVDEIIEEARERSVSADNYLEMILRATLRKPSRSELPEPPEAIKAQATPFRKVHGTVTRK